MLGISVKPAAQRARRNPKLRPIGLALAACLATTSLASVDAAAAATIDSAAADQSSSIRAAARADRELSAFYQARGHQPIWVEGGAIRPEARQLMQRLLRAEDDGLNPSSYRVEDLASLMEAGERGDPRALAEAEVLLSRALVDYVQDLRSPRYSSMIYVDRQLAPTPPDARSILDGAADAGSLSRYLGEVTRMNSLYTQLRDAFASQRARGVSPSEAHLFRANLERARALPVDLGRRYVLVDAAAARLYMMEDGEVRGSMRVIVGKQSEQTPSMAGLIRFATLNPYWNVPPDLVRRRIAPEVLRQGVGYLRAQNYEILSDWTDGASTVDPADVDWDKVASGEIEIRVRETPGPTNSMGNIKFMFPNDRGIYLHDTPQKALFREDDRRQSAGCVRLEDADRLARWLFGSRVRASSSTPEYNIDLPEPVPVYITYLTAAPEGDRIAFRSDVYGRDRQLMAQLGGAGGAPTMAVR